MTQSIDRQGEKTYGQGQMWKLKRWPWVILVVIISSGVYFTIRYGLRPKPIPVINPTEFSSNREIGIVVYKRLRQEIRAERVILLGSRTQGDSEIWQGLLDAAVADHERVVRFAEGDVTDQTFAKSVGDQVKAGQLAVVMGPTEKVSHLVDGSMSKLLDRAVEHPVLAISTMDLAVNPEEYDQVQTECLSDQSDRSSMQRLHCAAQRVARKFLKRRLAPEKVWAVMERHGLKEYLLFVHHPPIADSSAPEMDGATNEK